MPTTPRATYSFNRLCFKKEIIEPLNWDDEFRVITPAGTFQMSKAKFYEVFDNVVQSSSYRDGGIYHYKNPPPKKSLQFKLTSGDAALQQAEANPQSRELGVSKPSGEVDDTDNLTRGILEANLESLLVERLDLLEEGLQLIQRQYTCPGVGRIDILSKDRDENLVVIEIKKFGVNHGSVLDQILRYMGYLKEHVAEANQSVRGIIVVGKVDEKLRYAVSAVPSVKVKTFDLTIK